MQYRIRPKNGSAAAIAGVFKARFHKRNNKFIETDIVGGRTPYNGSDLLTKSINLDKAQKNQYVDVNM
jgi:hypothetical protein